MGSTLAPLVYYFILVCRCPRILKPVCGANENEYGNACLAECDGVKAVCEGKCPCKECK